MEHLDFDVVIVGTGPAGLGAAFKILEENSNISIALIDKNEYSTGGMRNDCKMNFTFPIGFPLEYWEKSAADYYLKQFIDFLKPQMLPKINLESYQNRAQHMNCSLLDVQQTHLGTDGGLELIKKLQSQLREKGVTFLLGETVTDIDKSAKTLVTDKHTIGYRASLIAPGRAGFKFLQHIMQHMGVSYIDNVVDVGMRLETKIERYPIVKDYYDPKFYFPNKVRTFCTNSGNAHVVKEKYVSDNGNVWYSVNGHAFKADEHKNNGLVNFAVLRTVRLTSPLASGQDYAEHLGQMATLLGGGKPIMQRVGDFRMGKRSKEETFNGDFYDFVPTLNACPGDIALAMPEKILKSIWQSMKSLDTIIPGILHPSTVMYYPEIKLYANKPQYLDSHFKVAEGVYFAGDGAGTSRGITGAWASGIRAAEGILAFLCTNK